MAIVLWNGFTERIEVFRGTEEDLLGILPFYKEHEIIFFYAKIKSIELEVPDV